MLYLPTFAKFRNFLVKRTDRRLICVMCSLLQFVTDIKQFFEIKSDHKRKQTIKKQTSTLCYVIIMHLNVFKYLSLATCRYARVCSKLGWDHIWSSDMKVNIESYVKHATASQNFSLIIASLKSIFRGLLPQRKQIYIYFFLKGLHKHNNNNNNNTMS